MWDRVCRCSEHWGQQRLCTAERKSDNQPLSVSPHLDAPVASPGAKGSLPRKQDDAPYVLTSGESFHRHHVVGTSV